MAASTPASPLSPEAAPAWDGLKRAIMTSSGFQSWCLETGHYVRPSDAESDRLVMSYLRETLETLAY